MDTLNITSTLSGLNPVNISEFRMVTDRVAQVIVNAAACNVKNMQPVADAIMAAFQGDLAPIANSFSWLVPGKSMIGYVATTQVTREVDDKTLQAYRVLSSNLYMDASDESLWEMKDGAAGRYLARQGHDDLSALIEARRSSPRGSVPRLASVISASAAPKEFVAFVHDAGYGIPSIEYGFCVGREKDGSISVLSSSNNERLTVHPLAIVSTHQVALKEAHATIQATKKFTAATTAAMSMEEYYRTAYQYAPD